MTGRALRAVGRWLPITGWLRRYDRRDLRADVVAGLTVAALVIPKNLGYAGIAHLPVEFGLYAVAGRRAVVRGVRHVPPDRDWAELVARCSRGWRSAGNRSVSRRTDQRVGRRDHDRVS